MADSMEPCKMLWGRPLLPWQRNLGYAQSPVAYRLVFFAYLCLCQYLEKSYVDFHQANRWQ